MSWICLERSTDLFLASTIGLHMRDFLSGTPLFECFTSASISELGPQSMALCRRVTELFVESLYSDIACYVCVTYEFEARMCIVMAVCFVPNPSC